MGKRTMVNRCVRGGGASAFGYSDSGARTVPPALNPYGGLRQGKPRQRRAPCSGCSCARTPRRPHGTAHRIADVGLGFSLEGVDGAAAVLDRDPALLGERLDTGRAAEFAVTRVLHAAERGHRLIGDALIVDVDYP
jgi:hypothetical protein